MIDIQYSITIMGGREISRPYRVWFFAEGELFFMFLFQSPSIFPLNPFRYRWHRCIDICRGDGGKKKGHAFLGACPFVCVV